MSKQQTAKTDLIEQIDKCYRMLDELTELAEDAEKKRALLLQTRTESCRCDGWQHFWPGDVDGDSCECGAWYRFTND